jgi:hypothetical protein
MKKILGFILLLTILFTSCSSNDDDSRMSNFEINPPDWIQGTWMLEEENQASGYKFKNDDFCIISILRQTCHKELLSQSNSSGVLTSVNEEITENSYLIEMTLGGQIFTYEFIKISSNQIEWLNNPFGDLTEFIYTKIS